MADIYLSGDSGLKVTVAEGSIGVTTSNGYAYFNMMAEDYRYASIVYSLVSNMTLTLEGTNDHTADSLAAWTDVTNAYTGAASATTDGAWILDTTVPFPRMRVRMLTSNASNSTTVTVTRAR